MGQRIEGPNVKQTVPLLNVSNMDASVRFYVDGLGFKMIHKWDPEGKLRWCWLQHGGAAFMIQEMPKEGHDSWVPSCKVGEGVSFCFMCQDAIALYKEFLFRGLKASKPMVGNGLWVTELSDPDGYSLAFESPTDTPEETVYSE
jgi:catechol 2,3-dioxygenase-like lactoylglutathione lyase family enzyme